MLDSRSSNLSKPVTYVARKISEQQRLPPHSKVSMATDFSQQSQKKILFFMTGPNCTSFTVTARNILAV